MNSLKLFAALVSLFLLNSNLSSQTYKWEFAIEAGAGIRNMFIDPDYPSLKTTAGLGFASGIAGQYNFDNMWALKLGASYDSKGCDLERTDIQTKGEFDVDYISIPLLL